VVLITGAIREQASTIEISTAKANIS
jgi:hypothetical protein